ncbi:TetR family transcriptional regulator [Epidermidibacterium keratini]|uniref:TetR family transcriptional regulator n=1 Tax=Epidermidibacterium keratini TaxID=1891644 RepID=A0A7L4YLG8_9ACTN|nr:TetR family transcriptional regulator C-terminal domain-containing protein [Epidermidibacterium keratini]QHC00111.1 TetR family transcriptional regulator [Epidermidibacterium keratini]
MVRTADHVARRAAMTAALLDVATETGLDSVTVAKVARAAGVSVGLVQHYFASKDALLQAAYAAALGAVDERIADVVDRGEHAGQPIRTMASNALSELLPLDEQRRRECVLRIEFLALATQNRDLAASAAEADREFADRLARVVDNGKLCGEVPADLQSASRADELLTIVTGMATRSVVTGERNRAVLDAALARTFSGECHQHG